MTTRLHYFDIYGRGESIRLLLAHAKVDYEDVIVTREQLPELKASGLAEFGQVPVLERNGKTYVQSWSILRTLGAELGYYPTTDAELAYQVDSSIEAVEDFIPKYFRPIFEQDETKKAALIEDLVANVPRFAGLVNARLERNEDKLHLVGTTTTIADIALATVAFSFIQNPAGPFAERLAAVTKAGEHPLVDAYFQNLATELAPRLTTRGPRPF